MARKKLQSVSRGPKGLVKVLNDLIGNVNGIDVTPGAGIYITNTADGGWIISTSPNPGDDGTAPSSQSPANTNTGPLDGGWLTVDVVDENCNRSTIQVWGKQVA